MAPSPVASALAVAALVATQPSGNAPELTCAPFRVMSYNILESYDVPAENWAKWSKRRDDMVKQLQTVQPTILGMQEITQVQKEDLERALPGYTFLGVAREDGQTGGEATNIAVNNAFFDIQSSGTFWLSPTPDKPSKGWDAGNTRIATWAHLVRRSDGRRLLVLNTHLDSNGKQARFESAHQIADWLAANKQPGELVVVTGDFNSGSTGQPVTILTSTTLGLRDSRPISRTRPFGPEGTFNGGFPGPPKWRIDFVLVDPAITVEHYATLPDRLKGGGVISDHYPVVVDLSACSK
jgi:endonuclease/exonuclease/phosphatase family metal-dependent hydrolase